MKATNCLAGCLVVLLAFHLTESASLSKYRTPQVIKVNFWKLYEVANSMKSFAGNLGYTEINDQTQSYHSSFWSHSYHRRCDYHRRCEENSNLQARSAKIFFVGMLAWITERSKHKALIDLAFVLDFCYNILLLLLFCTVGMLQLLFEYQIIKSFQKHLWRYNSYFESNNDNGHFQIKTWYSYSLNNE